MNKILVIGLLGLLIAICISCTLSFQNISTSGKSVETLEQEPALDVEIPVEKLL